MYNFLVLLMTILIFSASYAKTYTVQKNDSLWQIAVDHKIGLSDLKKLNEITRNTVYVGQKLFIPSRIVEHTVKSGETFSVLTSRYDTKLAYIITLNNLADNQLYVGQTIRIPLSSGSGASSSIANSGAKSVTYTVRRGDTLSDIALKYNTTVPKLRELNNKRSNTISAGEKLIVGNRSVPIASSSNPSSEKSEFQTTHKVQNGETLGAIAIKYGVSSAELRKWNNKRNSTIYVGEIIKISPNTKTQHSVRSGENLSEIAYRYKVSASDIKKWNNKSSDRLYVGEKLTIFAEIKAPKTTPVKTKTPNSKLITYKVKRGDTLDGIAIKYDVRRSQVMSWNNKRRSDVYIGESLKIYVPITSKSSKTSSSKASPKKSYKSEYSNSTRSSGIKTSSFRDIPLPLESKQIIGTTVSGRGVDITVKSRVPLEVPQDAYVKYAGYISALQNVVILEFEDDRTVVYAGLGKIRVKTGQDVSKGTVLGIVGFNSIEDKSSFYMEIRQDNKVANVLHAYKELVIKK